MSNTNTAVFSLSRPLGHWSIICHNVNLLINHIILMIGSLIGQFVSKTK